MARRDFAIVHEEEMGRVCFRDVVLQIQHEGVVGAGVICFNLGQDGVEQIGVMNLRDRECSAAAAESSSSSS